MEKKIKSKALMLLLSFAVIASCLAVPGSRTESYGATAKNSQYSLAGAEYQLYLDAACRQPAKDKAGNNAVLVTKADGTVDKREIETGTYYAKEIKASKGYLLDTGVHRVDVTKANTEQSPATFNSTEMPTIGRLIELRKYDQTGTYDWKKLLGAEYTLRYYDVDPSTKDVSGMTPVRTWKFRTVKKVNTEGRPCAGIDFTNDPALDGSDDFYTPKVLAYTASGQRLDFDDSQFALKFHHYRIDSNGTKTRVMPIGIFTIEETKAPGGLARNETVYYGSVSQPSNGAGAITSIRGTQGFEVNVITGKVENLETPQSVEISVEKFVGQTGTKKLLGKAATLAGAEYNVYYDDPELGEAELVGRITTDDDGKGRLTTREMGNQAFLGDALRPGTYFVEEVSAPEGFLIDKYVLAEDGSTEEFTGELQAICDYTENGTLVKKSVKDTYEDGKHKFIARVQATGVSTFKYTVKSSEYETETHIRKTDAATSEEVPGAKLQVFSLADGADAEPVEEWVSTDEEHIIYGLTNGRYLLREITAPDGYDVAEDIEFEVKDNEIVTKVEMQNKPITVGTVALDKDTETHHGIKSDGVVVTDTVKMTGLYEGRTYKVSGTLMDKKTGEPLEDAEGNPVTAETEEFVATGDEMEVELEFTLDASKFDPDTTLVAFERLFRTKAIPVAADRPARPDEELPADLAGHEDIDDEDQSVHYGGIASTVAVDAESGSHNVLAAGTRSIKDTVRYRNLVTGQKYLLEGEWYDRTDRKLTGVKAGKVFTPTGSDGLVEVEFKFDTSKYEGHTLVCFEKLFVIPQDGKGADKAPVEVSSHEDPEDEDQTIHIPKIRTTAEDSETNDHLSMTGKDVTINDTVRYRNLIPDREYTVKGVLMVKSTGRPLKAGGKEVTAEKTFTAKKADGEVTLSFVFDGSALQGRKIVAFEKVYYKSILVASHTDITDEDQSVSIPKIRTKTGKLHDNIVTDTVAYKGLIPGRTYICRGWFVDRETGNRIPDSGGKAEFTAENESGYVEVDLRPGSHKGPMVAFEEVYLVDDKGREVLVGEHKDIDDPDQLFRRPKEKIDTGDPGKAVLWIIFFTSAMALLSVLSIRTVKKRRSEDEDILV